jgi:hypothetical protein
MFQNVVRSQVLVAHTYNPSHSGGRDQEDPSSNPVRVNSLGDSSSKKKKKKKNHKKSAVEWLSV